MEGNLDYFRNTAAQDEDLLPLKIQKVHSGVMKMSCVYFQMIIF